MINACHSLVDDIDNGPLLTVYHTHTGLSAGARDADQLGDVLDSCPPETRPNPEDELDNNAYLVCIL